MKKSNIPLRSFLTLLFLTTASLSFSQTTINSYAAVLSYQECDNALTVDATTGFAIGDTILMIQMKGAVVDTTNTAAFGNVLSYNGCGNYEYNVIKAINGNNISLVYNIVRNYDIPLGKVQLVSVPSYQNYTVAQPHTCMAWNGVKGGVFAISVTNTLTLNNTIDVTGKGFKGGKSDQNPTLRSANCVFIPIDYCMAPDFNTANNKGEGITEVSLSKSFGIGKLANGGGSGFSQNSGGGGGSNGSTGGKGGSEYVGCNSNPANNLKGGIGGLQLNYSNLTNKVFLGGGGGSGHVNNINLSNGGNGGGICVITAGTIIGNNRSILANGEDGLQCVNNGSFGSCHDGMAGGGGGGVVMMNVSNYTGSVNIEAKGGIGADENGWSGYYQVGPGGGGSGGIIWHKNTALPGTVTSTVAGGANGVVVYSGESWGAQPGSAGQKINNLILINPVDSFDNSDISSDFSFCRTACLTFSFNDQTIVTAGAITGYSWNFGDGSSNSSQQNTAHTFPDYGVYTVTFTVFTSNGCSESVTKIIDIPYNDFLSTSDDTTICSEIQVQMHAYGGVNYTWSPANGLNNSSIADPIATVTNTMVYFVTAEDSLGCTDQDSVRITYQAFSDAVITPDKATICGDGSVQLNVTGINNPIWTPAIGLNNQNITNPIASPSQTTTYFVTGTSNSGCDGKDSITIIVYQTPDVKISADHDTINCTEPFVNLTATGGTTYAWKPAELLNNSSNQSVIARIFKPTEFFVQGIDSNGCKSMDSIYIQVTDNKLLFVPNAFSPNGDGQNDAFLPKYNCDLDYVVFSVYNRFGQRVFTTGNKFVGWTGLQNGKDADAGTYFWVITGKDNSGKITRRGDVTLIR